MTYNELFEQVKKKKSFLCVGLDSDIKKIPAHLLDMEDPVFEFNKAIVDATADVAIAYKPNIAFYESRGVEGWRTLEKTVKYIKSNYPEIFMIADAKRGDIGNTSEMYARAFLETLEFDSITVAPYMGEDSVTPFLKYEGKWVILLALTSNKGAYDFQFFEENGVKLYERVLRGGSLEEVAKYGMNSHCGLIVNSSRGIIFADKTERFAERAREEAVALQRQMETLLKEKGIL